MSKWLKYVHCVPCFCALANKTLPCLVSESPYVAEQKLNARISTEAGAESDSAPQPTGQLPSSSAAAVEAEPRCGSRLYRNFLMNLCNELSVWIERVPDPSVPWVAPSVPLSVRESVCQMFYSTQLCVFLAPGCLIRKRGGGVRSPEWGHDCFMFPNLPDHRRLTSNNQNTCFQTELLVQPLLR